MNRKQLFVNREFQVSFAMAFVRGFFICLIIPVLLFVGLMMLAQQPLFLTEDQRVILSDGMVSILWRAFLCWLIGGGVIFIGALIISHRYAGPMRRIEHWCGLRLSGSKTGPLVIREKDNLAEMVRILNRLIKPDIL